MHTGWWYDVQQLTLLLMINNTTATQAFLSANDQLDTLTSDLGKQKIKKINLSSAERNA